MIFPIAVWLSCLLAILKLSGAIPITWFWVFSPVVFFVFAVFSVLVAASILCRRLPDLVVKILDNSI